MMRCISLASALVVFVPSLAWAQEAPGTERVSNPSAPRYDEVKFRVGLRGGMTGSTLGSSPRILAPNVGVDAVVAPWRYLGFSALYSFSYASRGTSELAVGRYSNVGALFVEGRAPCTPFVTLRLGIGAALYVLSVTTSTASTSLPMTLVEPRGATQLALDAAIPGSRFAASIGGISLFHPTSVDIGIFAGASYSL